MELVELILNKMNSTTKKPVNKDFIQVKKLLQL